MGSIAAHASLQPCVKILNFIKDKPWTCFGVLRSTTVATKFRKQGCRKSQILRSFFGFKFRVMHLSSFLFMHGLFLVWIYLYATNCDNANSFFDFFETKRGVNSNMGRS